ncbi:MAG: hypothetical protein E6R08_00870 [Nevskiaceae bacterium]|nr:MAG: hypothetical protein E6R08_00870 [Nevskiaceae bacterium]
MSPRSRTLPVAVFVASVLAACGGGGSSGQKDQPATSANPAAGLFSGTDSFGNPAAVLIAPGGTFASVVSLKSKPGDPYSVSIGAGQLTPLVFASSSLSTFDLDGGVATGALTVSYTQGVQIRADLAYANGTRTLVAQVLPNAYASIAGASLPSSGAAAIYVPQTSRLATALKGSWSYSSSGGTFSVVAGDCAVSGRAVPEVGLNALVLNATPSAGCGVVSALDGYAWNDTDKGVGYAVLAPSRSNVARTPMVIVLAR